MIIQYPHYLFATIPGESYQDENGNWIPADNVTALVSRCREETDGRGQEMQTAGGVFLRFTSLVQLPKDAPVVDEGTSVIITNDEAGTDIRMRGAVLKFDNGQLHSRLWV